MNAMSRDIAAGVEACRTNCDYFSVCGGGAPVNKLAENGGFTGTRTSFCSLTQMVPVDLILDAFDRLESGVNGDDDGCTCRDAEQLQGCLPSAHIRIAESVTTLVTSGK